MLPKKHCKTVLFSLVVFFPKETTRFGIILLGGKDGKGEMGPEHVVKIMEKVQCSTYTIL